MSIESDRQPLTAPQIIRAREVAALLHVPVSTVHDWARTGRLPSRKRGKHRLFVRAKSSDGSSPTIERCRRPQRLEPNQRECTREKGRADRNEA